MATPLSSTVLKRTNIDCIGSSIVSGGWPRPSLKWQPEHEFRLKRGPNPSKLSTEAGALIHWVLNNLLPNVNRRNAVTGRLVAGLPKAFLERLNTVVSPPKRTEEGTVLAIPSAAARRKIMREMYRDHKWLWLKFSLKQPLHLHLTPGLMFETVGSVPAKL